MPETLYLTTNLIDRFLELKGVSRKNLQLVRLPPPISPLEATESDRGQHPGTVLPDEVPNPPATVLASSPRAQLRTPPSCAGAPPAMPK